MEGLHQLPRHVHHVGGFILTEEPLGSVVPIEPASMPERTVIQWEKDDLDGVGLVKIDLLGLGMLTVVQDCLLYIRHTRATNIDLGQLDMTDQAVYDVLCAADTVGLFQVESRAQMNTLPRLKPRCFYDLVVQVSLIRPGPIQGEMVHPYLRRRAGLEAVTTRIPSWRVLEAHARHSALSGAGMQVAIAARVSRRAGRLLRRAMGTSVARADGGDLREIIGAKRNGIPRDRGRIYNQSMHSRLRLSGSHAAS